ncbi:RuvX/YqgF family protein [Pseudothermotoga sp.]|nr:RuvX/YqgF family protein [Pseudothermotoga sp.]MDW8139077.1 RuvX/YqgF family protein [Pseudothermotoga sp.]
MKIVAVDYGEKKCGVAIGERVPSEAFTVDRVKLLEFLRQCDAHIIVVGIPFSMTGRYSRQTFECVGFAEKLMKKLRKEVFLVDERLSSKMFRNREHVDSLSAVEIFERFVSKGSGIYSLKKPQLLPEGLVEEVTKLFGKLLIADLSDVRLCRKNCVVLQKEPYYAYLFYKKGCHVERDERFLEDFAPFDIIVTWKETVELKKFLSPNGKIVCL